MKNAVQADAQKVHPYPHRTPLWFAFVFPVVFLAAAAAPAENSRTVLPSSHTTPGQQAASQQTPLIQHEAQAVNIEVPVRVFRGETFIDGLTIDDFELYEDGAPQEIEAVYLIRKTSVQRREEPVQRHSPQVARKFVLLFEIQDYLPKVDEAVDFFFSQVILPGDSLTVITPRTSYSFRSDALNRMTPATIASQLKGKIRQDVSLEYAEYKNTLREVRQVLDGRVEFEDQGMALQYIENLYQKIENLRYIDEKRLVDFAAFLKNQGGQKHVFFFYQKETLPVYSARALSLMMDESQERQDIIFKLSELFEYYRRDVTFDVGRIQQAFSDSSIAVHFLYLTKTPFHDLSGEQQISVNGNVVMKEQSEDIFSAFSEVSKATGGISSSSANAASLFQKAVEASENYYLIYYTPKTYAADGKFRRIDVRVKGGGYRITHRTGYIAD